MKDSDGEEKGRRQSCSLTEGPPCQSIDGDNRQRAGSRDDDPAGQYGHIARQHGIPEKELLHPRDHGERRSEEIERQRRPVEEVRVEIAAEDPERMPHRFGLVRTRVLIRQPEPDGKEA